MANIPYYNLYDEDVFNVIVKDFYVFDKNEIMIIKNVVDKYYNDVRNYSMSKFYCDENKVLEAVIYYIAGLIENEIEANIFVNKSVQEKDLKIGLQELKDFSNIYLKDFLQEDQICRNFKKMKV